MAISVAGSTLAESASASSLAGNVPAGTTTGDILVAVMTQGVTGPVPDQAGWTLIAKASQGSTPTGMWYRLATSSEPASYTFTATALGRMTVSMHRLTGVDTTTPLDAPAVTATTGSAASVTTPSITTVTAGALLLFDISLQSAATNATPPVGPTILTNTGGVDGRRQLVASEPWPTAGATGTRTWTFSASIPSATISVALRPSSGGPPPVGTLAHLWTGVPDGDSIPVTAKTSGAAAVRLKVGTNSAVTTGVIFTSSATPSATGYTNFTVTGLTPGTAYWYQAELDGVLSAEVGSFKTDTPVTARSFRVAFGSCLEDLSSVRTAFDAIVANAPELFLQLGDIHYADSTSTSASVHAADIADQIAANGGLKDLIRSVPTGYIWSDHDSGGNDWTGGPAAFTPSYNTAYRDIIPVQETLPSGGIYHSVHRGRVKFILTDGRSYKSPRANADDAAKTFFGTTQEAWIAAELADPNYPIKVLCVDVPWVMVPTAGDDKWGGYKAAAQRLADDISSTGARVFLIHGDAHSLCADDGTSAGNTGGLPVAGAAPTGGKSTSIKGGPYSAGTWPTSANIGTVEAQHGLLDITDTGTAITIRYSGRDTSNVERVTLSTTFDLTPPPSPSTVVDRWNGTALVRQRVDRWNGTVLVEQVIGETPSFTVLQRAKAVTPAAATSLTATLPGAATVGATQVLVLTTSTGSGLSSVPTGWTQRAINTAQTNNTYLLDRIVGAATDTSVTLTFPTGAASAYLIEAVGVVGYGTTVSANGAGPSASYATGSITPDVSAGANWLIAGTNYNAPNAATAFSAPVTLRDQDWVSLAGESDIHSAYADGVVTSASPVTVTITPAASASQWETVFGSYRVATGEA